MEDRNHLRVEALVNEIRPLGILVDPQGHQAVALDDDEHATLRRLLEILRRKSWFSEWLTMQASFHEKADPSPLDVAGSLVLAVAEFDADRATAERMIAKYPKLFKTSSTGEEIPCPAKH